MRRFIVVFSLGFVISRSLSADQPLEPEGADTLLSETGKAVVELYNSALENAESVDYENAIEEVRRIYEQAREKGEDLSGGFYEWMRKDIAQYNIWEYRILTVASGDDEKIAEEMNTLGEDRWECIGVSTQKSRLTLVFKRRPASYLRHIPVKELLGLFGLGAAGE